MNDRAKRAALDPDLCDVPCFKKDLVRRLRARLPDEQGIEDAEILFGALADRNRLKLLLALTQAEELCVCDVAHVLGMSVSVASHHLRKLRDLRILKHRNDGKMSYYSLRVRHIADVLSSAFRPEGSE